MRDQNGNFCLLNQQFEPPRTNTLIGNEVQQKCMNMNESLKYSLTCLLTWEGSETLTLGMLYIRRLWCWEEQMRWPLERFQTVLIILTERWHGPRFAHNISLMSGVMMITWFSTMVHLISLYWCSRTMTGTDQKVTVCIWGKLSWLNGLKLGLSAGPVCDIVIRLPYFICNFTYFPFSAFCLNVVQLSQQNTLLG